MNFDELDESDDHFRQRIFELIRATLVQCWINDHGAPPTEAPNDEVLCTVVIKIADHLGSPGNEEELVQKVKKLYRTTSNIAAMRKGLN